MSDSEQKYTGGNFRGAEHASPYPVSRLGAPMSLVDMAKAIESASGKVAMRTNAQLEVIVEQMKARTNTAAQDRPGSSPASATNTMSRGHASTKSTRVIAAAPRFRVLPRIAS